LDGVKKHSDNVSGLWVVRLNAFGDSVLWSKSYGGSDADSIAAITATQDGGFLIAACSKSSASGDFKGTNKGGTDLWILKLDAEGNLEWEDNFGGTGHEVVVGITAGTDGT